MKLLPIPAQCQPSPVHKNIESKIEIIYICAEMWMLPRCFFWGENRTPVCVYKPGRAAVSAKILIKNPERSSTNY